jgi:DNA-binding NarL/FixJ family response regulator
VRTFRPDLVITDMRMPGLDGIELVSALKAEGLATRALILTGHLERQLVVEAVKAGAEGYLLKDAPPEQLIDAVRTVNRGETYLQPAVATELTRAVGSASSGLAGATLTPRELEVLRVVAEGLRNKEIARSLHISEATVKFHVANVFAKLGVGSRTEATRQALELGILGR